MAVTRTLVLIHSGADAHIHVVAAKPASDSSLLLAFVSALHACTCRMATSTGALDGRRRPLSEARLAQKAKSGFHGEASPLTAECDTSVI